MLYEIINPSDPVTLESDNDLIAALCVLYLGDGKMGLEREDGETVLPLLLFGGEKAMDEWVKSTDIPEGMEPGEYISDHLAEMAEVYATALVGDLRARKGIIASMEAGGGDVQKAMAAWNEGQRSSMNDICGSCFHYAEKFREAAEKEAADGGGGGGEEAQT